MAKTCPKCKFQNNPDDAHFCGSCGASLYSSIYRWTVVDMYGYSRVSTSELQRLRDIEKKYNSSPWKRMADWVKKIDIDWEWVQIICALTLGIGFIVFCLFFMLKGCSENEPAALRRVHIDGKYGVGYDKEHMLLNAEYADISGTAIGDQWVTTDAQGKKGVAYVSDSIVNRISPAFSDVDRYGNSAAVVVSDTGKRLVYKGQFVDDKTYKDISSPGDLGLTFVLQIDGKSELVNMSNWTKTDQKYWWWQWADGALRMRRQDATDLYTYDGRPLLPGIYQTSEIADSMIWAYPTKQDWTQNKPTLYNTKGKMVKSFPKGTHNRNFGNGIGWIQDATNKSKWIAIDRNANELFTFYGENVKPYTKGLAPVFKNMSGKVKMGMIDTKGAIVIPCKYTKSSYGKITFDRDSTMEVTLDGVKGRLHHNGTFKPL